MEAVPRFPPLSITVVELAKPPPQPPAHSSRGGLGQFGGGGQPPAALRPAGVGVARGFAHAPPLLPRPAPLRGFARRPPPAGAFARPRGRRGGSPLRGAGLPTHPLAWAVGCARSRTPPMAARAAAWRGLRSPPRRLTLKVTIWRVMPRPRPPCAAYRRRGRSWPRRLARWWW
jgi:hypothetical protein